MPVHSSKHVFLPPVDMEAGSLFDGLSFLPFIGPEFYINGALDDTVNISGFGGIQYGNYAGRFGSEALMAVQPSGLNLRISADGGQSFSQIFSAPSGSFSDMQCDVVGGAHDGGSALVSWGSTVCGVRLLNLVSSDAGLAGVLASTQALGGVLGDTTTEDNHRPMRVAFDEVNEIYWCAGKDASDDLGLAYKDPASDDMDASGGWNFTAHTNGNMASSCKTGRGPTGASGEIVCVTSNTGRYWWADGGSPGTVNESVDLSGLGIGSGANLTSMIYNRFHDEWLIMPNVVDFAGGNNPIAVKPANIGSSTAGDYEARPTTANFSTTGLTLQYGNGIAVGPWCFFETDKGGSLSGLLATPDMGRTWYFKEFLWRHTQTGELGFITTLGKWDGRLVVTVGRSSEAKTMSYVTPRLEPVGAFAD